MNRNSDKAIKIKSHSTNISFASLFCQNLPFLIQLNIADCITKNPPGLNPEGHSIEL